MNKLPNEIILTLQPSGTGVQEYSCHHQTLEQFVPWGSHVIQLLVKHLTQHQSVQLHTTLLHTAVMELVFASNIVALLVLLHYTLVYSPCSVHLMSCTCLTLLCICTVCSPAYCCVVLKKWHFVPMYANYMGGMTIKTHLTWHVYVVGIVSQLLSLSYIMTAFHQDKTHTTTITKRKLGHPCLYYTTSLNKNKKVRVKICTYLQNDSFQKEPTRGFLLKQHNIWTTVQLCRYLLECRKYSFWGLH